MLRLATVFSGIGAIEHALDRMELEHEIVFACDNGDVDILSKKIDMDFEKINRELTALEALIKKINVNTAEEDDYKVQLDTMLVTTKKEYAKVVKDIAKVQKMEQAYIIVAILDRIIAMEGVKKTRVKEYREFIQKLQKGTNKENRVLNCFLSILKVVNDFKKDNALVDLGKTNIEFKSVENIVWIQVSEELKKAYDILELNKGKKIIKKVRDISERTGMLHEKINSLHIIRELAQIEDYAEKKRYVDRLYTGKENQNKVKTSYMENYKLSNENFHWNVSFFRW